MIFPAFASSPKVRSRLLGRSSISENIVGRFHQPSPDLAGYPSIASGKSVKKEVSEKGFGSAFLNNYPV